MNWRPLISLSILAVLVVGILFSTHEQPKKIEVAAKPTTVHTPPKPQPPKLVEGSQIEDKLNQYRTAHGLNPLADNPTLDIAAQARAEELCTNGEFNHNLDWTILRQYYTYQSAGENLYYGGLRSHQENDIVDSWIASPEHLANIVGDYSEFGVGVKACPGYQGASDAVIVTNYFGVPR